jgi:hypothetical protein
MVFHFRLLRVALVVLTVRRFSGLASVPFRFPFGVRMFSPSIVATSGWVWGLFLSDDYNCDIFHKSLFQKIILNGF